METKYGKTVKLQTKFRALSRGYRKVPWLTISGIWLEELGFKIGDTVNITSCEKLLIIELLESTTQIEKPAPKKRIK